MFPQYLEYIGFFIAATVIIWIPIVILLKLWAAHKSSIPLWTVLTCDSYWGPAESGNREASRAHERAHRVL
ncbi:hypothetical protein L596_019454 [Steinernema carpocapsae]|nr:hypothetical protein L596_019454 [Steinernema carpocapsae]